ncbi:MAG: hypothetical protein ABSA81_02505 [Candidatus Bathyarchaeia archaeon]
MTSPTSQHLLVTNPHGFLTRDMERVSANPRMLEKEAFDATQGT